MNIDSTLDGTWLTKMDVEAQTGFGGGFIFKDTSIAYKKSTVTVSDIMHTETFTGAQGPAMPVTIANSNVEVTHIFSNFYRLALDENMNDYQLTIRHGNSGKFPTVP